jgi:hypothetical protein
MKRIDIGDNLFFTIIVLSSVVIYVISKIFGWYESDIR